MPSLEWNKEKWPANLRRILKEGNKDYYGTQWGDPELKGLKYLLVKLRLGKQLPGNLSKVHKRYIKPYIGPGQRVLEIGPGGGRWTQYLLDAGEIYLVDLNTEFFPYLEKRFPEFKHKFHFYQSTSYEMSGIAADSIDFIFTFGVFVHIEPEGIDAYLGEIKRVLKPGGIVVIQYADKSKKRAREIPVFSDMDTVKMEKMIAGHGLLLLVHDRSLLNHSNIVVTRKARPGTP